MFESSVIPYGDQTNIPQQCPADWFESSVIPYGDQTNIPQQCPADWFESSVIPYGDQTPMPEAILLREFESSVIPYGDIKHAAGSFHTPQAYFTCPRGQNSLKKALAINRSAE